MNLRKVDQAIFNIIEKEKKRQNDHLELIASENYVSKAVLEAVGSILTNKYAEGYPNKRYYGGCENVDEIENIAKNRLKELFDVKYVNVQPHSGSQANMAVFRAILKPNDVVVSMALGHCGHLTHGYSLSFSGQDYQFYYYHVDKKTGLIDYDELKELVLKVKPTLVIAGASAYPRIIDFRKFREICDLTGSYLMVDMAHIAGLVATKLHMSPVPYADVVTSTTHKTLRGTRGGIIMTNSKGISEKIDRSVFPGIQGGPLMHVIAGKAVTFKEALEESFTQYQKQVINNAKVLANSLLNRGFFLISGGTDNHLLLVDAKKSVGLTGKECEQILENVNITCNKNTIPYDLEKPMITSGIRLGTPAVTTRGMKEKEMMEIADCIADALFNYQNYRVLEEVKAKVLSIIKRYPLDTLELIK